MSKSHSAVARGLGMCKVSKELPLLPHLLSSTTAKLYCMLSSNVGNLGFSDFGGPRHCWAEEPYRGGRVLAFGVWGNGRGSGRRVKIVSSGSGVVVAVVVVVFIEPLTWATMGAYTLRPRTFADPISQARCTIKKPNKTQTLNPKPWTPNPKPQTLDPKP